MKTKVHFLLGLLFWVGTSYGQATNSWINPNQTYFKLMVTEDGWYRVTNTELVSAGVPISSINPARVQLYYRGQEVAIDMQTANSLVSYFDFYGKRNDGQLDTPLYTEVSHQPNSDYSLFTDSSAYFLTWSSTQSGKRITFDGDQTKSVAAAPYFLEKSQILQVTNYSEGQKYGEENKLSSGTFAAGEGWTGAAIGKTGTRSFTFSLGGKVTTGAKPTLSVLLAGGNNQDHLVEISVGPSTGSQRVIGTATFSGYTTNRFTANFEWSDVGAGNECVVVVRAVGFAGIAEQISVSAVEISYPKAFSITSASDEHFDLEPTAADRYFIQLPTTIASSLRVFDITDSYNPVRRAPAAFSDRMEVVLSGETSSFLVVNTPRSVANIRPAITRKLNPAGANYLIVSHPALRVPANDGLDQLAAYESYRESVAGGQFQVYTAHIQEIYDQFGYGDPSPLALRNYFAYAISVSEIQYGLLIGKGLNLTYGYGRTNSLPAPHYVPTFGLPGSDVLFSAKIGGDDVPKFPVGRVSALSPEEIRAYLNKVKEQEATPYEALWRKNLIHISGGQNAFELTSFFATISNLRRLAESDFLGGKVSISRKQSSDAVETINLTDQINNGVSMITFFGHSGSFTQDVEIGNPSKAGNPNGFTNQGRYPVMLLNGCNSGSIFDSDNSYLNDWVRATNLGAIAGVAHVDFASSSNLRRFSDLFYQVAFGREETFGWSVGQICQQVYRDYFSTFGNSLVNESQVYGMLLIGDPAVRIFGADRPDYTLSGSDVFVSAASEDRPLATSTSFPIFLVVRNLGRTVTDSLEVRVERTLPNGTQQTYLQRFPRPLYQDTLRFEIENTVGNRYEGQNIFTITLDPEDQTPELGEANNQAIYSLFLNRGNTLNLFPIHHALVPDEQVALRFQALEMLGQERTFALEVDTLPDFSSSFLLSESLTGRYLSYDLSLQGVPDSTVVYWRTRFASAQPNEDTTWVTSSFTLVRNAGSGWAMTSNAQLSELDATGVSLDPATGAWAFGTSEVDFQIIVHGQDAPGSYTFEDFKVIFNGNDRWITDLGPAIPKCRVDVMGALFIDRETSQLKSPLGLIDNEVFNPIVCGQQPQLIFNMSETDILGANRYLDSLIALLDNGDGMVLFSLGEVAYSAWDAQIKSSLSLMGINTGTVDALVDGQPVIFYGVKGQPGAVEVTSNGTGLPLPDQQLEYTGNFMGRFSSGRLTSPRIGPARSWTSFEYDVKENGGDQTSFVISGITKSGLSAQLFSQNRIGQLDISTVDADTYPYLQLEVVKSDLLDLTPPVLRALTFQYDPAPDGMLISPQLANDELPEGQSYARSFQFFNPSDQSFADSVQVSFTLVNTTSGNSFTQTYRAMGPEAGDTLVLPVTFPTVGKVGTNNLNVTVSGELEQYGANNQLSVAAALVVEKDEVNPVLDVTFDGSYILNGDIVSPRPSIRVRLRDDNPYLFKNDTSGLAIYLKEPCETCQLERVAFSDPKISYTAASDESDFEILYQPGPLEDGDYILQVQGQDESGNNAGSEPYEIGFQVINASSITHFFPYPNPFSTRTRFVFTLTGSELPDEIKIQIMTVTGRVVREITQDEIGPIKIGQNITQYAWDGRDEFGDQLANGVYLYKVFIRQNGERVDHRFSSADRAFKHGFGKIYLLR